MSGRPHFGATSHFGGGHYLLALKANQSILHDDVRAQFNDADALDYSRKKGHQVDHHDTGPEKAHGRIEQRITKVTNYLDWFEPSERKHWLGLRSFVEITSIGEHKGVTSTEKRYYLSTHAPEAAKLGDLARRHWGIENRCHWVLDMTFDAGHCRVRKGSAAENLALLRKLTLNLLRHDQTIKDTMRGKRIQAAHSETILETLLKITISK